MQKLNKRELKFILPAVLYGWYITEIEDERGYWDGDPLMPVKCGNTLKSIIEKGYMYLFMKSARRTEQAMSLKCRASQCFQGDILDGIGNKTGKCKECNGTGIKGL